MNLLDSTCALCPVGTYSDSYGATGSCTPCPAGTYSNFYGMTTCTSCPAGTYSAEGATACTPCPTGQKSFPRFSSCFAGEIFDGELFVIQSQSSYPINMMLSAEPQQGAIVLMEQPYSASVEKSYYFTYNSTTMQIYNPATNLCLDDLGHGYSVDSSTSDTLAFTPCSSSKTQQFAYFPSTKHIMNPNNPYDKCLYGNNNQYSEVFLSQCPYSGLYSYQWDVVLSCMPGTDVLSNFEII